MRATKVCVLGGSGFVGTRLCAALARRGYRTTVPTRHAERARHLRVIPAVRVLECDIHDAALLGRTIAGHDAVVNLVGTSRDRGRRGAEFRRVHEDLVRKLVAACREKRIDRLLHVSALNADADHGPSRYLRSKGQGERIVREEGAADLRWTVVRPSVIFGPGDALVTHLAGILRRVPVALPLARPEVRLAPVWVGDVAEALMTCLSDDDSAGECYELCGPEILTMRAVALRVRDELRLRRAIVGLPDFVARIQAGLMGVLPGATNSTDNFLSLTVDSVCARDGFARLGLRPRSLDALLPDIVLQSDRSPLGRLRRSARR